MSICFFENLHAALDLQVGDDDGRRTDGTDGRTEDDDDGRRRRTDGMEDGRRTTTTDTTDDGQQILNSKISYTSEQKKLEFEIRYTSSSKILIL